MEENERVELLKLLEDYHKESNIGRLYLIDTHRFVEYNED